MTPVPGTVTLHPQEVLTVQVIATQFPSSSAVVRCVVCLRSSAELGAPRAPLRPIESLGVPCSICIDDWESTKSAIRLREYSRSKSPWGTSTKSLSPSQ